MGRPTARPLSSGLPVRHHRFAVEPSSSTGISPPNLLLYRHQAKPFPPSPTELRSPSKGSQATTDAYIADLSFDIGAYLAERNQYALIAAPSGLTPPRWWDINAGVFAINLGHAKGRELVDLWFEKFMAPPLDVLSAEQVWGDVIDDQAILHDSLNAIDGFEAALLRDEGAHPVFNWDSRFIRQVVRDAAPMWLRIKRIEEAVNQSLAAAGLDTSALPRREHHGEREEANEEFVEAVYQVMFGRNPDPGGRVSSLAALRNGDRTYRDDLRSCMESPEFKDRLPVLLKRILTDEERQALAAALV